jgi:hypothetical protein
MPRAQRVSARKPASRLVSHMQGLTPRALAQALLKGEMPRDGCEAEKSKVMKNPDESFLDVVVLAMGPLMAAQLFAMVMMVVSYAHP